MKKNKAKRTRGVLRETNGRKGGCREGVLVVEDGKKRRRERR